MTARRYWQSLQRCMAALWIAGCPACVSAQSPIRGGEHSAPSDAPHENRAFGRTRLSFFAGGSLRSFTRLFFVEGRTIQAELQRGPSFGARITRDLAGPVALDTSYRFRPAHLAAESAGSAVRIPLAVHQVSTNALVFLCGARCELRPFFTAGADFNGYFPGAAADVPEPLLPLWRRRFELPIHFRPGFNFGGGFEAAFHRRLAVRFEVRDHISQFPGFWLPPAPSSPGAPFFPPQPRINDIEVSAGAVIRFR